MEIGSQKLLDAQWPSSGPTPFGSLMKPFVALAHGTPFPEIVCHGCWKPDGHGRLSLIPAIACSCNAYFVELARGCSVDAIARTAAAYGLDAPSSDRPEAWIGLGDGWRVTPASLIRAFAELALRRTERTQALVLQGMRSSARSGTARDLHLDAYAKTGTGPCSHARRGSGDGFAVALYPAEAPRDAWLVGLHNRPGSDAARVAGNLIR
jgi:cell division protein FtsI/penicillin-binding protein 2